MIPTELAVSVPGDDEAAAIRNRLAALRAEQTALEARLAELDTDRSDRRSPPPDAAPVTASSSPAEKIALFRSLFRGREDVFPKRWSNARSGRSGYAPACANEWAPRICDKPRIKCRECPNQAFIPVTAEVIARHLRGRGADGRDFTIGVYPMLPDETCWFLAIDFDKKTWRGDVAVFLATCRALGVAAVLERSRSGNGGHVWIFFTDPVPAASARRLGAWLLTESMERNPDIGFESYDRLFPNQDTLPAGGFGNLIALPLQQRPRQSGNSVFLDDDFQPHADQWRHLSSVRRMTSAEVADLTDEAGRRGRILGVRLPVVEADEAPWLAPPSRKRPEAPIAGPLPETVEVVFGDQVYVADYGHLVVDECHHLSAVSFEAVARRCKARYVLGLSATVTRKDGHHPIIFMQCGPVRFRVDARRQAAKRPFSHRVVLRDTHFALPAALKSDRPPIQSIYGALAKDEERNELIVDDVLRVLENGRSPIVLTERKEHAWHLAERLSRSASNVLVLHGGLGQKARRELATGLSR